MRPSPNRARGALAALAILALIASGCAKKKPAALPPAPRIGTTETGLASWYGYPYHGRRSADGEIYDMNKFTAAHRTLPFGTWVEVTNLSNQEKVRVRITDRGPFVRGRIIDLSRAAAKAIDLIGPGVTRVRLMVVAPPTIEARIEPMASVAGLPPVDPDVFAVQVGAFADRQRAEQLRASLAKKYGDAQIILRDGRPPLWRVLVGREPDIPSAERLAQRLRSEYGTAFVVRLDQTGSD